MAAAITARDLGRRYGERPALENLSLDLEAGLTLAIFGSNGAGKSTLLRLLAGLLRPHSGELDVLGADLPKEAWRVRGRIGYLGHDPLLYRELSPRENLAFHARLHGVAGERVERLLEQVGLADRADDPVRELSRGMVQRAAVGRAVLHDPELLLLDEPRAGLDPAAVDLLEPLIGRGSERTRVLVSHDVETTLADCDVALGLRGGKPQFLAAASAVEVSAIRELYA